MRILHTADWHLGDRLGRIDRTGDLRQAVERVAVCCADEKVDVLLVAGDLFSELSGPDSLRETIRHLQETFGPFMRGGGTVLTLTGNHDKENFCQTLRLAMQLAAPDTNRPGELAPPGRLYLATEPTLLRLVDRVSGVPVQFVLMPYPTPARYLTEEAAQKYLGLDEKNRFLLAAYTKKLADVRASTAFDPDLPAVLGAHVAVQGSQLPRLFRLSEQEDVVFAEKDIPADFAYVALGHIHKAQSLAGVAHVRYSGSIERMDLGESLDDKGVVVFDVGPAGLEGEPRVLPLPSTSVYEVVLDDPKIDIPLQRKLHPDATTDLVRIVCKYTAGVDNREELLRDLEDVFPRWYEREISERNELNGTLNDPRAARPLSFEETVRSYLEQELTNVEETFRAAVLGEAELLMGEVEA